MSDAANVLRQTQLFGSFDSQGNININQGRQNGKIITVRPATTTLALPINGNLVQLDPTTVTSVIDFITNAPTSNTPYGITPGDTFQLTSLTSNSFNLTPSSNATFVLATGVSNAVLTSNKVYDGVVSPAGVVIIKNY